MDCCCVLGCSKSSDDGVTLHEFPFHDKSLLPIWIMATHRPDWTPLFQSRMCSQHFDNDDFEDGDKNKMLKPNACPMVNSSDNVDEDNTKSINSDLIENSSTSDTDFSDDLSETPDTSDMNLSDVSNSSSDTSSYKFGSSSSSSLQSDSLDNIDDDKSSHDLDVISVSSDASSIENTDEDIKQKCAVALCNEKVRNQFDKLLFIDFPEEKVYCNAWWKLCGQKIEFDPSFKICSIHFNPDDISTSLITRNGLYYRRTYLKHNVVPSLYLTPQEYTRFNRKRKNNINNKNNSKIQKNSAEGEKCIIESCQNTFSKDRNRTLFFKIPLEQKEILKKWLDNVKLFDRQPLETDLICSDHFENFSIKQCNNDYELDKDAIPSINPENPFVLKSKEYYNNKDKKRKLKVNYAVKILDENSMITLQHPNKEDESIFWVSDEAEVGEPNSKNECSNNNDNVAYYELSSSDSEKGEVNETNMELKIEKNAEITDDSDVTFFFSDVEPSKNLTSKLNNRKRKKKTTTIDTNFSEEETVMVPISKNSGNDSDYIYLDSLSGNDNEDFILFEEKRMKKNIETKIPKLEENHNIDGVPKAVIYNDDLIENLGEMFPAYCDSVCEQACYYSIPGSQRTKIYEEFRMLGNEPERNCKITRLVKLRMIKNSDNTFDSYPVYHLVINNALVKVCRTFFMNTLGIPENRLKAVLEPANYTWFSDEDNVLKSNQSNQTKTIAELDPPMTDFVKESLKQLEDSTLFELESESNTEVRLENMPYEEYKNVISFIKTIPRILSSLKSLEFLQIIFETSLDSDSLYMLYSESCVENNHTPCTKCQFQKIYNQYLKNFY